MSNPIVSIEEGRLRGKSEEDYLGGAFHSFLGIPYGQPPIGDLRFKAPVPVSPWEGVRDATKEGPECPSRHMFFTYHIGAEDNCLSLNVYTKNATENGAAPKPVMVWIHGGAFLYGSNKQELFGPHHLMTEDIVLVTINYRLGVFGFLSLEDTSLGIPGNAGMKDMVLALKWVQRNIRKFNGDPNNVTIFGESAGGAAVHYLYLSPLCKGLFHRVIAQSGSALCPWAVGERNGRIIAKTLGYKETQDERKILEYLKNLSSTKIVTAQHKVPDDFYADKIRPFGPVVEKEAEGAFLTQSPLEILKQGKFNDVPIMMGYASKEGMFFEIIRKLNKNLGLNSDFELEIPHDLNLPKGSEKSRELCQKLSKFYYNEEKPSESNMDNFYLMKTDNQFVWGIQRSIQLQKQVAKAPNYLYRISVETPLNLYKRVCTVKSVHSLFFLYYLSTKSTLTRNMFLKLAQKLPNGVEISGVCHADELAYLFTSFVSPKLEKGTSEETSVRRFLTLWTNFARTGSPIPEPKSFLDNVEWKPVNKEANEFLDIGTTLKTGTNPEHERMSFWESVYSKFQS